MVSKSSKILPLLTSRSAAACFVFRFAKRNRIGWSFWKNKAFAGLTGNLIFGPKIWFDMTDYFALFDI